MAFKILEEHEIDSVCLTPSGRDDTYEFEDNDIEIIENYFKENYTGSSKCISMYINYNGGVFDVECGKAENFFGFKMKDMPEFPFEKYHKYSPKMRNK